MWVDRHRPRKVALFVGNDESRLAFMKWLKGWGRGSRPALLIGPPGTGKSSLVYAAAEELRYKVMELNASDVRTKERLAGRLEPILQLRDILGEDRIIFLDEVDGIFGRADYGGTNFLLEVLKGSRIPIVLAANLEEKEEVRKLMSRCEVFRFRRVPPRLVELYVSEILRREGIAPRDGLIRSIAEGSQGDLRAALNDAQTVFSSPEALRKEIGVTRDRGLEPGAALDAFFRARNVDEAYDALQSASDLPQDRLRTIYSSIVSSLRDHESLATALDSLSKADELLGEVMRTQRWRLIRYFDRLLAHSLMGIISKRSISYSKDDIPWSLKVRIWNEGRSLREMGRKLGARYHVNSRDARSLFLPYLALILARGEGGLGRLSSQLRLTEEEARLLSKEVARAKGGSVPSSR